jgi:hypothetical protein
MTQASFPERRTADWPAAAVAGLAAGAILMMLDLFWSIAVTEAGPWAAPRMIAAIVMGPQVLQSSGFDVSVVALALLAHYAFGISGGIALAAISTLLRFDSTLALAALTGAAFGAALYLFNFYGMSNFFPWFGEVRGWPTFLINLIFGVSAAVLYWKLERRGDAAHGLQQVT